MGGARRFPCLMMCVLLFPAFAAAADSGDTGDAEAGVLRFLRDRIEHEGLIEFGALHRSDDSGEAGSDRVSEFNLITAELAVGMRFHSWIRGDVTLLYEDALGCRDRNGAVDAASVTLQNRGKFPLSLSVGRLYVPFGAALTRLPDDPAVDQPMTLLLGETREEAVVAALSHSDFVLSGYLFEGDIGRASGSRASFGLDGRYELPESGPVDLLLGISYISNIASSNCLAESVADHGTATVRDYVGGIGAYAEVGFAGFFASGEYLTALGRFQAAELARADGGGARPSVWNIETGYNWDWGRKLEVVLKIAGSAETEKIGLARRRLGFGLNQEICRRVTASFALLGDRFHPGDIDGKDRGGAILGQVAVRF
ncbi:MAG: LbtU family siderophore porin [Acidobacteria bacterium]|nr:LbtU family siderophore porin [Acidobacteriota bacterium]